MRSPRRRSTSGWSRSRSRSSRRPGDPSTRASPTTATRRPCASSSRVRRVETRSSTARWRHPRRATSSTSLRRCAGRCRRRRSGRSVRACSRILDAGCGVGRDALAFAERGYSGVAFDASSEMVRLATQRTAGRVELMRMGFDDVDWLGEFDGVWACASLLHVPAAHLPRVLRRLGAALRPGGALYMSFKFGAGERAVGGRRFTDHTEKTLRHALGGTCLALAEIWVTGDVRAGRTGERWLNAIATRLVDVASPPS